MFTKTFTNLATIVAAIVYTVAAKSDAGIPVPGKYLIQNAASKLYMDAEGGSQAVGTPVIVFTLDQPPPAANQVWTVDIVGGATTLQSISSSIVSTISEGILVTELFPGVASPVTFSASLDGVYICANTAPATCFTSPPNSGGQIFLAPFAGTLNQTWIFSLVTL